MRDEASDFDLCRTLVLETVGSTNAEGLERARRGQRGPLWIRAMEQTEGRGRIGRPWASPRGNLYTSLLLTDPGEGRVLPQLGFVAGVALARTVRGLADGDPAVELKWPNDLVYRGAKLAGILVEGAQDRDGSFACVIGIGVNCLSHPEGLAYAATDLATATGATHAAADVARGLQRAMAEALRAWDSGRGFPALREAWLSLAHPAGRALSVRRGADMIHGAFDGLDLAGRLRLATPCGLLTIEAGDVFPTGTEKIKDPV